jgi:hypothetical protein
MAHRNRWFTVLKNGGSFHGKLLNNQLVTEIVYGIFGMQRYAQLDSIRPSGDKISMNYDGLGWISHGMSMQHMQHTHIACFDHYVYICIDTDIEKHTSI